MTEQATIKIPANLKYSSILRNFTKELLTHNNIEKQEISRSIIVLDEIFSNAVKYGSRLDQDKVIVNINMEGLLLVVSIEDTGKGNGLSIAEVTKFFQHKVAATDTNGRGLAIIAPAWTDNIQVKQSSLGGINITFSKDFSK